MELARLLEELTEAGRRLGVAVRFDSFEMGIGDPRRPHGGLCTIRGQRVILVDANAPLPDQIATVAASLSGLDLEGMFLPPIVRATIAEYRTEQGRPGSTGRTPAPLARARRR